MAAATKDAGLFTTIATLKPPEGAVEKFDEQWLTEVANDLLSKPGASLVLAGSHQPVVVQFLVYAINSALKNIGATLIIREFARNRENEQHSSIGRGDQWRPDQAACSFLAAIPFTMRRAELRRIAKRKGPSIGPISRRKCPTSCASVIMRMRLRP